MLNLEQMGGIYFMEDRPTIELRDLWNIIKIRIKIIIIITLGSVVITGIFSFYVIKPVYEAKTSIIIGPAPGKADNQDSNSSDIYLYQKLMKTYSAIASSQLIGSKTAEKLNNGVTKEQILQNINVSFEEDTLILNIKYQGRYPEEVTKTLNTLSECIIEEAQKVYPTDNIKVIDREEVSSYLVRPNKNLNLSLSFFLGLMISFFVVILLEYLDNTIKSEKDIKKCVNASIIGTIPKDISLLRVDNTKPPIGEVYRIMRNNIQFSYQDKRVQTIAITSAEASDGKTTTAFNLAASFSERGKTVLIDCNLRNPKLHQIFGVSNSNGISNFVIDKDEVLIKPTAVQNLSLITAGTKPYNPSQILISSAMKDLIGYLRGNYDYIICDTPQVMMLPDTQIISQYCDGCIMVVSFRKTKKEALIEAKDMLMKVNTRIIGTVMNRVEVKATGLYYHHKHEKRCFLKRP